MLKQAEAFKPALVVGIADIPESNKNYLSLLGSRRQLDQTSGKFKYYELKVFTKDPSQWSALRPEQKTAASFGYQELAILHNPMIKDSPKDELRELTDEDKAKALELRDQGKDSKAIASELPKSVRIKDVEAYFATLQAQ